MDANSDSLTAVNAYFEGLNNHDLDALLAAFTDTAAVMFPGEPTATGPDEIHDFYAARLERFRYGRVLHVDDGYQADDFAVARCHTTGTLTLQPEETTMEAESRELFTLRRSSDGWRIQHYMANQPVALPH